jgi:phosphoenolpyruvate synthase/pyruvate phosphate dikinase
MTSAVVRQTGVTFADAGDALRLGDEHVGGKALSLAKLEASGERVPEWLVIPAEVLLAQLEAAGLSRIVERELHALAAGASQDRASLSRVVTLLQTLIDTLPLDPALLEELDEAAECLGEPLAVRSSAVGEDGERFSFAGQFDSVLNIDRDQLSAAVRYCWRSAFSLRALEYRRRAGSLRDAARLAVIVQRQVTGNVSGVLFTLDPLTGDQGRMRVSACRGLGDALVSGAVDGDEYLIDRQGAELGASRISREHRLLGADALRELASLGRRLSQTAGPRDIEWTIRDGELWVLQDRPVTSTMSREETANRIVWDNSNIQESYCGVTTPLTFSFARTTYASVYEQTMGALGVPEATIARHRPMLRNLLGLLQGRVYYNLNSWYRGLLLLPAFRRNKEDMERMMGVEEPVDFVLDEAPTIVEQLRRIPRLARTFVGLLASFATLDRRANRFLARFDAELRAIDRPSLHLRTLAELMELLERLRTECIERWTTPIINDFHVMMSAGRLRRLVARTLVEGDESERLMQTLLGGAAVEVSTGPARLMLRLAAIARGDLAVLVPLREQEGAGALATARDANAEFAHTLDELLEHYGDRCMGELKLESRSLRDDPAFVVRMLRNYLNGPTPDPERLAGAARVEREGVERGTTARLGMLGRMRFPRALAAARGGIARRETLRLARTRLFGMHRDVYRAIGQRLQEMRRLDRADDVFYLTTDEIQGFWDGTAPSADLASLARARRAEFAAYERVSPPNRIVTTGAAHEALRHAATLVPDAGRSTARLLRGLGCSAGVVEGIVRIVRSPSDDLAIDGHILVAPRTDPGWAPLFPSARAIVVERGSLLSHSAVLARELGLPAVVGFPGILDLLRDGERVRVDGAAGTIERLELPCES